MQTLDLMSQLGPPPESGVRAVQGMMIDARYRVDELLGHGSMGFVFRAHDVVLQRPVAVKVLSGPCVAMVDRFQMEARALAQLRHENVVQIYSFGDHRGFQYMIMELVEGRTLESIIEDHDARGALVPWEHALDIVRRVLSGLAAVHERLLVHRDVKPGNIVVDERTGRPVLLDFGLARPLSESPTSSVVAGTPCYMAPEQARDGASLSARSDIYALACTAFELFTGRPVFESHDIVTMCLAHAQTPAPLISSRRPELAPLDPVFERALAKDPDDRYQSCDELRSALDEAVRAIGLEPPAKKSPAVSASARAPAGRSDRPAVRVMVVQRDGQLRRTLLRALESALRAPGDDVEISVVEWPDDVCHAVERRTPDILLIDDDDVQGTAGRLVEGVRATSSGRGVQIAVIATNESPSLPGLDVREIPKPVNLQAFRSVITKMGIRIAEGRVCELLTPVRTGERPRAIRAEDDARAASAPIPELQRKGA